MRGKLRFRAINVKTKEIIYIEDLCWFEEQGIHNIDDDGIARGLTGDYYINQCTYIKDKHNKFIYEEDICKNTRNNEIFFIAWHGTMAGYVFDKPSYKGKSEWGELFRAFDKFEIIGNVYTNPELLEENKNV